MEELSIHNETLDPTRGASGFLAGFLQGFLPPSEGHLQPLLELLLLFCNVEMHLYLPLKLVNLFRVVFDLLYHVLLHSLVFHDMPIPSKHDTAPSQNQHGT